MLRSVLLLVLLLVCECAPVPGRSSTDTAQETGSTSSGEVQPRMAISGAPTWTTPAEAVGEQGARWLQGGFRYEAQSGSVVFAETVVGGVLQVAGRDGSGWLFRSEAGNQVWRADTFLGELEPVPGLPAGVRLLPRLPLGTDGRVYVMHGGQLRSAPQLDELVIRDFGHTDEGWIAIEAGGDAYISRDEGQQWESIPRAQANAALQQETERALQRGRRERRERRQLRLQPGAYEEQQRWERSVRSAALEHLPLAASLFGDTVTIWGGVIGGVLHALDGRKVRIGRPRPGCRRVGSAVKSLVVSCADGLYVFQFEAGRWAKVTSSADDTVSEALPKIVFSADASRILVGAGCDGHVGHRCLIDRESGRSVTIEREVPLEGAFGIVADEVLAEVEGQLVRTSLETGQSRVVSVFESGGRVEYRLLADASILATRRVGDHLEAAIAPSDETAYQEVSLPVSTGRVAMANRHLGMAIDQRGRVYATDNGGRRWQLLGPHEPDSTWDRSELPSIECGVAHCHAPGWIAHTTSATSALPSLPLESGPWNVACTDLTEARQQQLLQPIPAQSAFGTLQEFRFGVAEHARSTPLELSWASSGTNHQARGEIPMEVNVYDGNVEVTFLAWSHELFMAGICDETCGTVVARDGQLRWRNTIHRARRWVPMPDGGILTIGREGVTRFDPAGQVAERVSTDLAPSGLLIEPDGKWAVLYAGPDPFMGASPLHRRQRKRFALIRSDGERGALTLDPIEAMHRGCSGDEPATRFVLFDAVPELDLEHPIEESRTAVVLRKTSDGACLESFGSMPSGLDEGTFGLQAINDTHFRGHYGHIPWECEVSRVE